MADLTTFPPPAAAVATPAPAPTPVETPTPAPLPATTGDEVVIHYNPLPAAERVGHYSGLVRSRLMWLALAAVICLCLWYARRSGLSRGQTLALFAVGVGYSVVWLVMALIGLLRARRVLKSIGQGIALRIGRWGIDIHGAALPWTAIKAVRAQRRPGSGFGPDLAVETVNGERRALPWLYLDTLPGTVDAAVQAFTSGARRLDVSKLDH